jgi:hypothetical protein
VAARPVVFLHIGAPKTGTTYLQNVLLDNRAALRRDGLLYPGRAERSHFWASLDLRGVAFQGHVEPGMRDAWPRLVREIRKFSGSAIISHEMLAGASVPQIERAVSDLSFADVHVIWTGRDLARQLPAAWQERLKNRGTIRFARFLAVVRAGPNRKGRRLFWPVHDAPAVLARWARAVPAERIHVVTVPPPGSDPRLLWQRFASVISVDPDAYDADSARGNASLSAAEAAVLRELNRVLRGADIAWPAYRSAVKHGLTRDLGENSADRGAGIELPADVYEWAVEWSEHAVQRLRAAGYSISGDLSDLIPATRPVGSDPDRVPAGERARAAVRMLGAFVHLLAEGDGQQTVGRQVRNRLAAMLPVAPGRAGTGTGRLRAAER